MKDNHVTNIDIVFACDAEYARKIGPVIRSILHYSENPERLRFNLISGALQPDLLEGLRSISPSLVYVEIDDGAFSDAPCPQGLPYITNGTYFRFLIGQCLPELSRVIYLDVDACFVGPIEAIWSADLGGAVAGVVANEQFNARLHDGSNLGFEASDFYFNAGMLVIDLCRWRELAIEEQLWANLKKLRNELRFADQDILNFTLKSLVKELPKAYNYQFTTPLECGSSSLSELVMLHFVGRRKPWCARCRHPMRSQYLKFEEPASRMKLGMIRAVLCLIDYERRNHGVCLRVFRIPIYKYKKKVVRDADCMRISIYCLWIPIWRSTRALPGN